MDGDLKLSSNWGAGCGIDRMHTGFLAERSVPSLDLVVFIDLCVTIGQYREGKNQRSICVQRREKIRSPLRIGELLRSMVRGVGLDNNTRACDKCSSHLQIRIALRISFSD